MPDNVIMGRRHYSRPPRARAGEAAAALVAGLLREAVEQSERLEKKRPEALHDFRVAVRRLRTQLSLHRELLGRAAAKKTRRRLRELFRETSQARDLEALLERLRALGGEGPDWAAAERSLKLESRAALKEAARRPPERLRKLAAGLEDGLRETRPGAGDWASALAAAAARARSRFEAALAAARSLDEASVHEARKAGKSLRYALEPAAAFDPRARREAAALKSLQDLVGACRDLTLLENRLRREGFARPAARARAEKARLLGRLKRRLSPSAPPRAPRRRSS